MGSFSTCLCSIYLTMLMHLNHLSQPTTCLHHTWQLIQGPDDDVSRHGRQWEGLHHCSSTYKWDTSFLVHLETHEDVFVPPQPLGGHYRSFAWISRVHPLYHYVWSPSIHFGTHWNPLGLFNGPSIYCIYHFALLRGLFFTELSWWACHKVMLLCTLFYQLGHH